MFQFHKLSQTFLVIVTFVAVFMIGCDEQPSSPVVNDDPADNSSDSPDTLVITTNELSTTIEGNLITFKFVMGWLSETQMESLDKVYAWIGQGNTAQAAAENTVLKVTRLDKTNKSGTFSLVLSEPESTTIIRLVPFFDSELALSYSNPANVEDDKTWINPPNNFHGTGDHRWATIITVENGQVINNNVVVTP